MYELIYIEWSRMDEELIEVTREFESKDELMKFVSQRTVSKRLIEVLQISDLT